MGRIGSALAKKIFLYDSQEQKYEINIEADVGGD